MKQQVLTFPNITIAALFFLSAAIAATGQNKTTPRPGVAATAASAQINGENNPAAAVRYTYEFKQPQFQIPRFLIEHDAAGRGRISFERKHSSETFVEPVELSADALKRIVLLWEALRFLDSDTKYQAEKEFPHQGTHGISMQQDTRRRTAEFNWTHDRNAFLLISEYRRIADQSLFVFDINIARQSDPLSTPRLMKNLDTLLSRNGLSDPRQLVPLMRDLTTDERLPLIARNHAERLLKKLNK